MPQTAGVRGVAIVANEFQAALDAARRKQEDARRESDARLNQIVRAREEALALVPEVKAAIKALGKAQVALMALLKSARSPGTRHVYFEGKGKRMRPAGWYFGDVRIPVAGEPYILHDDRHLSIEEYASLGQWISYPSGWNSSSRDPITISVAAQLRHTIEEIVKFLVSNNIL